MMKIKAILLFASVIFSTRICAQTAIAKPMAEKTVVPVGNVQHLKPAEQPAKVVPPPAPSTNIQSASISILNGDDGKDNDTYVNIYFQDNNQRAAASYSNAPPSSNGSYLQGRPNDEYFAGSSISLPMKTEMSIPTGQLKNEGSLILPVMRWATPGDFSNGGEIKITVNPNGHDTWKIQTLTVNFSFANDPGSPHKITWSNIVLSQNSRTRELPFDKNFNPL